MDDSSDDLVIDYHRRVTRLAHYINREQSEDCGHVRSK
jgi:hypothetical protein